jgi:release factor glutamine methyltransferase
VTSSTPPSPPQGGGEGRGEGAAEPWTPLKLLAWTQGYFARAGVDAPRLTAELLLASALSCDRVRLYLDFDKPLGPDELARYRALVKRRAEGEPTAYVTGAKEFYGRSFAVDRRALVPRPETELLVEVALGALPDGGSALDLCCGSGCVGVTLALERPGAHVVLADVSEEALALAGENARRLGATVTLVRGDLFAALPAGARFDVIAANPPYVPTAELPRLARELSHEPRLALDGGPDGLDVARRIAADARRWLAPGGTLAIEMHESHAESLPALCRAAGFADVELRRDLAGFPRLAVARAGG